MPRAILRLVVVLAVILGAAGIAEIWIRSDLHRFGLDVPDAADNPLAAISEPDPVIGTRYEPNASTVVKSPRREFEVLYQINEIGLRDHPLGTHLRKEARILVLGGASIEGYGVDVEDNFMKHVQQAIDKTTELKPSVHFIRAARAGQGAVEAYLLGGQLMETQKPHAILFFYDSGMPAIDRAVLARTAKDGNGLATKIAPATEGAGSRGIVDTLAGSSMLAKLAAMRMHAARARAALKPGDPAADPYAGLRANALAAVHGPSLQHVKALAAKAKAAGIPFVLVHLPLPVQVSAQEWEAGRADLGFEAKVYGTEDAAAVAAFCKDAGLECLALHEHFQEVAKRDRTLLFYPYTLALNPEGHRTLTAWGTTALYETFKKDGVLEAAMQQ
ncbi:MAG: hypothetical protein HY749_14515 [Gammaproteobacteria bacterium]|nr:hypothetical protein [Gammaproteobacteria bacterium]MBI5615119.1 hypothetical protein [Gammaproteobacteria bacterium]